MAGQVNTSILVQNVRVTSSNDKDFLFVGASLNELSATDREILGQYVFQFGDSATTASLRASGLLPRQPSRSTHWTFVNDEASYRAALNLRQLAYSEDRKLRGASTVTEVADVFDSRSRLILGRVDSRPIATARLFFPEHGDRLEHEDYFVWPKDYPRREETVEVTRTCTHPDYRRGNVFLSLIRFIVLTALQSNRTWVLTSSTDDLVPFYDWVGLKSTEIVFTHSSLNDLPHRLLLGSIPDALQARSVGSTAWYLVWRDVLKEADSPRIRHLATMSRYEEIRHHCIGALGALSMRWLKMN
jgi:hypothetical protein